MVVFDRFVLPNGLRVLVYPDPTTTMASVNILYNVGARDEDPSHTGFAHLFEHLMFGGSQNIPVYDAPLQLVGGENNAFTNNDITNYYLTLPAENLETAFWLESDRMAGLAFNKKSLDVQRNVVVEEFRQRYFNQPYGDVYLLLRPLAYKVHPYQWPTIGKEISHIEQARMKEVRAFFSTFYHPANAILVVAGPVEVAAVKALAEKWFGPIPAGPALNRSLPVEPPQSEFRTLTVHRNVPFPALYMAFHMQGRLHSDYYASDILSDLLSNGKSSRLYQRLVKEQELFSEISAFVTGDLDPGLFLISGKILPGVTVEKAEQAVWAELTGLAKLEVETPELEKVLNKLESTFLFGEMQALNVAMHLAYYELMGDAALLNEEIGRYRAVTPQDIRRVAGQLFQRENCSTLYYLPEEIQPAPGESN